MAELREVRRALRLLACAFCQPSIQGRVRSHCRFKNRGTEYVSESVMKWMSGGTKRECDRALSKVRRRTSQAGALDRRAALLQSAKGNANQLIPKAHGRGTVPHFRGRVRRPALPHPLRVALQLNGPGRSEKDGKLAQKVGQF